jgi:hypothetical protein
MANNTNLGAAKAAKNDEFYTQYADIQKGVNAYLEQGRRHGHFQLPDAVQDA